MNKGDQKPGRGLTERTAGGDRFVENKSPHRDGYKHRRPPAMALLTMAACVVMMAASVVCCPRSLLENRQDIEHQAKDFNLVYYLIAMLGVLMRTRLPYSIARQADPHGSKITKKASRTYLWFHRKAREKQQHQQVQQKGYGGDCFEVGGRILFNKFGKINVTENVFIEVSRFFRIPLPTLHLIRPDLGAIVCAVKFIKNVLFKDGVGTALKKHKNDECDPMKSLLVTGRQTCRMIGHRRYTDRRKRPRRPMRYEISHTKEALAKYSGDHLLRGPAGSRFRFLSKMYPLFSCVVVLVALASFAADPREPRRVLVAEGLHPNPGPVTSEDDLDKTPVEHLQRRKSRRLNGKIHPEDAGRDIPSVHAPPDKDGCFKQAADEKGEKDDTTKRGGEKSKKVREPVKQKLKKAVGKGCKNVSKKANDDNKEHKNVICSSVSSSASPSFHIPKILKRVTGNKVFLEGKGRTGKPKPTGKGATGISAKTRGWKKSR